MRGFLPKRAFDLTVVIITAPLWLPLLGVIAVLVWWKLGTPVLFRQKRPGLRDRIFELIKFRTMRDEPDGQGGQRPDAERLTSFGRWLRSTSLDELPEMFNVLKGEMSLVGLRPLLVDYLGRYTAEQARRHEVLPGLTGWCQVNGRNALTWEQKFALDLWYVDHHRLLLDVRILFLTTVQVAGRRGISAADHATMPEFKPENSSEARREKDPARTPGG